MSTTEPPEPSPPRPPGDDARPIEPPLPALPVRFVFAATGRGYFRIWIVNLLLTVVTLGIYSPWAKVRRIRYFYGNTLFDGSPFEFHGRPIALLKGRLIGLALLVAYSTANRFSVVAWLVVAAILVVLMPWLLWKSLRFRLANSSYRGIRFAFDGTIGHAYLTFVPLIQMFLVPAFLAIAMHDALTTKGSGVPGALGRYYLTIGVGLLFAPWFYFRLRAYQHRHARLGTTRFAFDGRVPTAYAIAGKSVLFGIALALVAGLLAVAVVFMGTSSHFSRAGLTATGGALAYLILIGGIAFPQAMIQNFVWNHSTLGEARFASDVDRVTLWWIVFSNLVLTLLTLGLFWPFAVVRSMRYRIGELRWSGDSGGLSAAPGGGAIGATGEETADLFGLDIAL